MVQVQPAKDEGLEGVRGAAAAEEGKAASARAREASASAPTAAPRLSTNAERLVMKWPAQSAERP